MKERRSQAELNALIQAHAKTCDACALCAIGEVYAHAPDENGCNWGVSVLKGSGCFECLEAIKPFLESLYARFDLVE